MKHGSPKSLKHYVHTYMYVCISKRSILDIMQQMSNIWAIRHVYV